MPAPIVAFAKDWHEDPTSNHHVLRELAKTRRVLWLNSIGTRTPKLSSGRDLGKMRRKLVEVTRGPVNVENDLFVFSPLVLPFPHSAAARRVNRGVLRATIRLLTRRLGMNDFQLWTFLPNVADYVGTLGESVSVYYCVDEWSLFSYLDREETIAAERVLLEKVDCVFAINEPLADSKRAFKAETHVAPHGVDHSLFARALDASTKVPDDIAKLPKPVLGFYGTLRDWVDLDLIADVARARPSWSIALIGQQLDDVGPVRGLPNVHLLGRKPHAELPAYCKGMDVGLIPYRIDERMTFVNPIKLREYLSAGLPVVSTPVPEVRRYDRWCAIADSSAAFIAAIEKALATESSRQERSSAMAHEAWPARVARVAAIVDDVARSKYLRHRP
jgi:glycosyltransferase involved in cell wall biosynthesis